MIKLGKDTIKEYWWMIAAAVHYVAALFWSRFVFTDEPLLVDFYTVSLNDSITYADEVRAGFLLTQMWAVLLILGLWYIVNKVFSGRINRKHLILFAVLFAIFFVLAVINYPDCFGIEIDNYVTYSKAIRYYPFYWHQALTSAFYGGCLYVLPHPFAVTLIQFGSFVGVVVYIFGELEANYGGKIKYAAFLFLLLPDVRQLAFNPYRNCLYTILTLGLLSFVFFRIKKNEFLRIPQLAVLAVLCAIVCKWRSEGILFGLCLALVALLSFCQFNWKKMIFFLLMFVVAIKLINYPQELGDKKYYGNDYLILSTVSFLQPVLNNPDVNLSYDGAKEDLEAIAEICPLAWIKQGGIAGYRAFNVTQGREEFNQTGASQNVRDSYMKAVVRILLHNPSMYIMNQTHNMIVSMGSLSPFVLPTYQGKEIQYPENLLGKSYETWAYGQEELKESYLVNRIANSEKRTRAFIAVEKYRIAYEKAISTIKVFLPFRFLAIINVLVIFIKKVVGLIRVRMSHQQLKKEVIDVVLLMSGLGGFCLVMLGAPGARANYYSAVMYYLYFL
ncbi:MAG: hypothetical protein HUJ70_14850, partial [Pseudobutyrivibrio sp.]|nr:hypothetical protein [Pseudobutyrivibrio sp.]